MRRSPLLIIYLTVFIDLLGFGIILPLLPFYAQDLGGSGFWIGALLTSYSAAQFFSAPIIGRLSDRYGRRPAVMFGLLGSAISLTITGFAETLLVLLAARTLAGMFGGTISAAQAYIADVTKSEERAKYMGLLGASIGLGFIFGPAIGAGLSGFGFGTAAFVAAALAALNLVYAYFKLPESRPAELLGSQEPGMNREEYLEVIRDPAIGRILAAWFLSTFAFVGLQATFALLGERNFDLTPAQLGLIFTYVGLVAVAVQGGMIGRLNAMLGERRLAATGVAIMGMTLILLPLSETLAVSALVLGFFAAGQGLITPTLSSLLSFEAGAKRRGSILGLGQSSAALARATGPIIAGLLYDLRPALPYFFGALLSLAAVAMLGTLPATHPLAATVEQAEETD